MRRRVFSLSLLALLLVLAGTFGGCVARAVPPGSAARVEDVPAEQLYRTGVALLTRGDLTRAEQYLASALRAGHDERLTMQALLVTTVRASRLRSALTYATPYLAAHPRELALRQLVAAILLALGEEARAEHELTRVLSLEEESPEAHYLLALVLSRRGATAEQTRPHLARYLELAPTGIHAEEARAEL
jgi:predicted Zn-dependent protease